MVPLNQNKLLNIFFVLLLFFIVISKKLLSPKSPLDEILTNFPFSILPINLKFFNFLDNGTEILTKSISISLLILEKNFPHFFG